MNHFFTRSIFVILALFGTLLVVAALILFFLSETRTFKDLSGLVYPPSFPERVTLQAQDNRKIKVELNARSQTHIEFKRLSDGALFVYPIRNLAKRSQEEVLRYPDTGLLNSALFLQSGQISLEENHIQQARIQLGSLKQKIDLLQREARVDSGSREQAIRKDIQKLEEKRDQLELSIAKRRPGFNAPDLLDRFKYSAADAFEELSKLHPKNDEADP